MYLLIDDTTKIITDCKFQTFGCVAAIAPSSMATALIKGKTIYEAVKITNNAALDDLPPQKKHCSVLAEEAIHAALKDYSQRAGVDIPGLKDITHEGSSHCDIQ